MSPGLHKWTDGGVLISADLTLDGGGSADAIFIFQIEGDLTIASAKKVILINGAQARNIFWQVKGGAGVVVGTTAHIEGIVLAKTEINVLTGASFNGKLLAQTAVNLDQNVIVDSDDIPPPEVQLEIISAHGTGTPSTGLYFNVIGTLLTNSITAVEMEGVSTQYVNTGWSMTGNDPLAGIASSMSMTQTNDAVLTWLWSTNYYLSLTAVNGAIISEPPGWKPAGQNFDLYPEPDFGYAFDHWELNGVNQGVGMPLNVTMDEAKEVIAYFSPIFVDVSSDVDWNVVWYFDPRKGYFLGTLTITNTNSRKVLLAPFWFEVESTDYHWLRSPDGLDASTGWHYIDISTPVNNQLSSTGNKDQALDVGESVTITGIELMGRRTPTGLLMAVWADPPGTLAIAIDTDGDGVSDADEAIAGTSSTDPNSFFQIRLGADRRSVQWETRPNRIYTVLISTNLMQGFTAVPGTIEGTGATALYNVQPQNADDAPNDAVFYKVEVQIK
jgi:hypothetical protein